MVLESSRARLQIRAFAELPHRFAELQVAFRANREQIAGAPLRPKHFRAFRSVGSRGSRADRAGARTPPEAADRPIADGVAFMKPIHKLDAEESDRALETAIRTQAQAVLELPSYPSTTVNGFLISGDQKAILMEITGRPGVNPTDLVNATCHVSVYSDQRYQFASEITAAPRWGETRSLAIARPRSVHVLERRRFVRAKLAPSSKVTIEWSRGSTSHRLAANLLNISVEGLACRMDDAAAAALATGDSVRVSFELPGHARPFLLHASVCNKTPASAAHTIVGIQFQSTPQQEAPLQALRAVLSRQIPAEEATEILV